MKTFRILLSTLAIAAMSMAFGACSSDKSNDPKPVKPDEPVIGDFTELRYAKIKMAMPSGSRGIVADPEFDEGTEAERAVKKVLFVFYNSSDRVVGYSNWTPTGNIWEDDARDNDGITAETTNVIQVNVSPGEEDIAKVVAFVNPTANSMSSDLLKPIPELMEVLRSTPFNGDYFVMNNSVYYEGNKSQIGTPISGTLHKTRSEITTDTPVNAIIYVERQAAKVNVVLADDFAANNTPITLSDRTMTFHPMKWILTGTNKKTYLIKHIPDPKPSPEYQWANGAYRFNWCLSYGYNATVTYPTYSLEVSNPVDPEALLLNYACFNDQPENNNWGKPQYCMENTNKYSTQSANLTSRTAVLLFGQYILSGNGVTAAGYNAGDDIYHYQGQFFTKHEIKRVMANAQQVLVDAAGNPLPVEDIYEALELVRLINLHPQIDDNLDDNYYSNRFALQVDNFYYDDIYYVPNGASTPIALNKLNAAQQNELQLKMEKDGGQTEKFEGGLAYFWIDIEHLNNSGANGNEGKWGVVRNHSYKLTINGINRLGIGIAGKDTPLIPPSDASHYYINARMRVLDWHVVDQQVNIRP